VRVDDVDRPFAIQRCRRSQCRRQHSPNRDLPFPRRADLRAHRSRVCQRFPLARRVAVATDSDSLERVGCRYAGRRWGKNGDVVPRRPNDDSQAQDERADGIVRIPRKGMREKQDARHEAESRSVSAIPFSFSSRNGVPVLATITCPRASIADARATRRARRQSTSAPSVSI